MIIHNAEIQMYVPHIITTEEEREGANEARRGPSQNICGDMSVKHTQSLHTQYTVRRVVEKNLNFWKKKFKIGRRWRRKRRKKTSSHIFSNPFGTFEHIYIIHSSKTNTLHYNSDIAGNWNIDIARDLEDYLEDLSKIQISFGGRGKDGSSTCNFAEAALLIQVINCL